MPMAVADAIQANKSKQPVEIGMIRSGNAVVVTAEATGRVARDMVVQLVRYEPRQSVKIDRGENAGRTIRYHNIVTDFSALGSWDGRKPFSASVKVPADGKYAVIIQRRGPGPIVAAARMN